ncbi:hypothetical protein DFQ27_000373, partial [Actinomortierella ambigua]
MTLCLLSLINIPPIAAALAHQLDFKDLKDLILVSHAFHDNLIPYMYQLPLQLSNPLQLSQPPVLSDALAGIERYGGYLRDVGLSLRGPADYRERLKEALNRYCRRLRVLHLNVTPLEILSSAPGSVVSLTRNNAGSLVELMIVLEYPRKAPQLEEAWPLRFIENCRHLAVLHLSFQIRPHTLDTVLAFGRCCPSLVELQIKQLISLSRADVHDSSLPIVANHSSAVCSSSRISSNMAVAFLLLENLSVGETDDTVLVQLVQHCPSLTSISFGAICSSEVDLLVQTLARTCGCGKLKSFAIYQIFDSFDIPDEKLPQVDMERMLEGMARDFYQLESFDLMGFDVSEELLLTIAAFVGPRLTKLSICDSRSIPIEGVAALLTQCPRLRDVRFDLEQAPMDPRIIFREPWACSATLERFTCPIGFRSDAEPEDMIYGAPGH